MFKGKGSRENLGVRGGKGKPGNVIKGLRCLFFNNTSLKENSFKFPGLQQDL